MSRPQFFAVREWKHQRLISKGSITGGRCPAECGRCPAEAMPVVRLLAGHAQTQNDERGRIHSDYAEDAGNRKTPEAWEKLGANAVSAEA